MNIKATVIFLFFTGVAFAEIPEGYYDPAEGLSGEALQWALHGIIDNHDPVSYDYIWTAFYTTDDIYGNNVWDMYSDIPGGTPPYLYTLGDDQGGSASGEGEGYNREHSWPKSWFGDSSPMNTDLFHIIPTDIYVNNRRANYPYAEVGSPTWTSMNGSRLGTSATPGYSGTAFEPIDGYKGDLARNYFYMATRYKGEDSGWPGSPMTDGADLEGWAVDLLLQWHLDDPVSEKELERNEAVYAIQDNRNPFIDHPEYAQMIYDPQSGVEAGTPSFGISLVCSPNPVFSTASFFASVPSWEVSSFLVVDITGRKVADLALLNPGNSFLTAAEWHGTGSDGERVPPGIYHAVLDTSEGRFTVSFLLMK